MLAEDAGGAKREVQPLSPGRYKPAMLTHLGAIVSLILYR
jgi:hypothetical protein